MARGTVRTRASGVSVDVELDGFDRTARAFRDARKRTKGTIVEHERQAAEETVLPEAKRNAGAQKIDGDRVAGHLVVRKRASGPYLTTNLRGMRARAAGLKEFGGTVRTPIAPKDGRRSRSGRPGAVLVNGSPRAIVRTARHYRARLYLTDAANEQLQAFGQHVRDGLVDEFRASGFEIS